MRVIFEQYNSPNMKFLNKINFKGFNIDVLIIDMINKHNIEMIDYCFSHKIKIILKNNRSNLDFSKYDHHFSDGFMTLEKDRLRKLERLIN